MTDITKYSENLYLIALKQNLTGFNRFINSWLIKGGRNILVDAGTSSSAAVLAESLRELGVEKLDAILITHIHIDHAGGVGDLLKYYPDTPVVVHRSGIKHLADPEKLWQGSLKTLGHFAEAYGPISPVPEDLLIDSETFSDFGISSLNTPGHAPHHVSYLYEDIMFAGEVAGVYLDLGDEYYLRPATPARFFLETSLDSLKKTDSVPHSTICFAHYGMSEKRDEIYKTGAEQLLNWAELIEKVMDRCEEDDFIKTTTDMLIENDPMLKTFSRLDRDVAERERGFMKNSIKGYAGYFRDKEAADK